MPPRSIRIRGARTHNLRDLDLDLPREAWTVVCGVSGSGKSSLVLDTLAVESRRRFLGSLTRLPRGVDAWARPDVDRIEGLPPAVAAGFTSRDPGPRQTLGTLTEVTHALRALFARIARPHCPTCGEVIGAHTRDQVTSFLLTLPEGTRIVLLASRGRGAGAIGDAARDGFVRVRVDGGAVVRLEDVAVDDVGDDQRVDVVVDRLVVKDGAADRFAASVEQGLELGAGVLHVHVLPNGGEDLPRELTYADRPYCDRCDATWPRLSTAALSFNSPSGACETCEGRGEVPLPGPERGHATCPACDGRRLGPYARAALVEGRALTDLEALPADDLLAWLTALDVSAQEAALALPALEDAVARLTFLQEVGLGHLAPARAARTLSGGELRRGRLAQACAARMSGLLYLLDEPTAGLHPVDGKALRARLRTLVDEGNTVVCVEHDAAVLAVADHVVELGPGAGRAGGRILAAGPAASVIEANEAPLARALAAAPPELRVAPRREAGTLALRGARHHNLHGVDVDLPLSVLTCLTGVSGAGKSTLLLDVLAPAVRSALDHAPLPKGRLDSLEGAEALDRVSVAGGSPPRHPRATPGSVLRVLVPLRRLFAATLDARTNGWGPSRFSRHVRGGRCEACTGLGEQRVALRDLAPARVPCDVCGGSGFAADTLRVRVKGLSIGDVLALSLDEAATVFRDIPAAARPLAAAVDVGLGYVPLGEPTSRLSGGEALRLKLAAALGRGGRTRTLYLLDEPSAGLHPQDVEHLAAVLLRLCEAGNTVVAVEHNMYLVRLADHVVEVGPGPGEAGGRVLYAGPPAGLVGVEGSPTATALRTT